MADGRKGMTAIRNMEWLRQQCRGLRLVHAFIIAAVAANDTQTFADVAETAADAHEIANDMRTDEYWSQIVVYDADDMHIIERLDPLDMGITTDAPLFEPLS